MGVFNFFIVIPQIVAAGILGFILKQAFANQAIYALVIGGISMIIAGLLNFIVTEKGLESPREVFEDVSKKLTEQRTILK